MYLTASTKRNALEQQLSAICMALKEVRGTLEVVATARRLSCRTAYYKDLDRSRSNQNRCYQRHKAQRSAKVAGTRCGMHVRSDYMRRHMRTAKCLAAVQRLTTPLLASTSNKLQGPHPAPPSLVAP